VRPFRLYIWRLTEQGYRSSRFAIGFGHAWSIFDLWLFGCRRCRWWRLRVEVLGRFIEKSFGSARGVHCQEKP